MEFVLLEVKRKEASAGRGLRSEVKQSNPDALLYFSNCGNPYRERKKANGWPNEN